MKTEEVKEVVILALKKQPIVTAQEINYSHQVPFVQIYVVMSALVKNGSVQLNESDGKKSYTLIDESKLNDVVAPIEKTKPEKINNVKEDEAPPKASGRDTSKFKFNGELYGKGRLVLAVIKTFIEKNPKTTLAKLKEAFPDTLQPRYGMVQEFSLAKQMSSDRDRYFLKPEELIKVGDKKIAVCNQFGSHNLPLKHFKSLGFVIK